MPGSCSCGGSSSSQIRVLAPNGAITTWRTQEAADAAAARTGGRVLPAR